jgi:hypothetical protein
MAVNLKNLMECTTTLFAQNAEFLVLNLAVIKFTTRFQMVNILPLQAATRHINIHCCKIPISVEDRLKNVAMST